MQRMGMDDLILPELSYQIIGCFYEVYRVLGRGMLESSYQEALAVELGIAGIACEREVVISLDYKGRRIHGFRLDLLVERRVIIECKTSDSFHPSHLVQLQNYLRVSRLPLGLLLLFGSRAVYKRVVGTS
jgi:GxxExxY protein